MINRRQKRSVVDPDSDPHYLAGSGSALFGRIRIRTVTERTDTGSIKGSQNKGDKTILFQNFLLDL